MSDILKKKKRFCQAPIILRIPKISIFQWNSYKSFLEEVSELNRIKQKIILDRPAIVNDVFKENNV